MKIFVIILLAIIALNVEIKSSNTDKISACATYITFLCVETACIAGMIYLATH